MPPSDGLYKEETERIINKINRQKLIHVHINHSLEPCHYSSHTWGQQEWLD